jgi:hypothetical protein
MRLHFSKINSKLSCPIFTHRTHVDEFSNANKLVKYYLNGHASLNFGKKLIKIWRPGCVYEKRDSEKA